MLIELKDILKNYQVGDISVPALKGISMSIQKNEYLSIMGPSGSGKSTLMNILGCLDAPTSGSYLFEGQDVALLNDDELSEIRNKKIGFVFQNFNLLPRMTSIQNVELPLMYAGISKEEGRERAIKALERVELASRMNHKPTELSGGQRQRVAIARALCTQPDILLADEPTGALDSKTGDQIMALFNELHQEGNTIILITHERAVAEFSKRIVLIKDGLIQSDQAI